MGRGIPILYVSDGTDDTETVSVMLEREDAAFSVDTATATSEALQRLSIREYDCIISDYQLDGIDGISFLTAVRERRPELPFVLFTAEGSETVASDAISKGATEYLQQRPDTEQSELLANNVRNAVEEYHSKRGLRETNEEYATVFENVQNGILLVGVEDGGEQFRYRRCNPRALELTGFDRKEVVGHSPREMLGIENATKVEESYRQCVEQGETVEYTVSLDLPVGPVVRKCEVTPVSGPGEIEQLVVVFRDITDQREREQELRRTELQFEAMFNDPNILGGLVDTDGTVLDMNETAMEYVAVKTDDIVGTPLWKAPWWPPEMQPTIREKVDKAAAGEYVTHEADLTKPDGESYSIAGFIRPVTDDEGAVESLVVSARDITDQRDRERQLNVLDRVLRHNMRNNVNVVRGWAETIGERTDGDVASFAERIVETSTQLSNLVEKERAITELLVETRECRDVCLSSIIRRVIATVGQDHPDAVLTVECHDDIMVRATTDIKRAIGELVRNAIIHNDSPTPTATITLTTEEKTATLRITDNGPTIPEMEREVLLGTLDMTPLYHGNGLGLWLVNRVVTQSEGRVSYAHNQPRGNVVSVALPQ